MKKNITTIMTNSLIVLVTLLNMVTMNMAEGGAEDNLLVVLAVAPIFPPIAVAANISGSVVIEVKIGANGKVTAAQIIEGHPLLRQGRSFEDTARRWQFTPSIGSEVFRTARLKFIFRIMPKETSVDELTPEYSPPYQVEVRHLPFVPVVDSDPPNQVIPAQRQKKKRTK